MAMYASDLQPSTTSKSVTLSKVVFFPLHNFTDFNDNAVNAGV